MANKLTDTRTVTAVGVYDPQSLDRFPEGGANFQVSLDTGTAVVRLHAWINAGSKELLGEFVLPVPTVDDDGVPLPNANNMYDSLPVYSLWHDWSWQVVSISGGGTLTLGCVGVGV